MRPGARREHNHAVGQIDRLLDVVGNEDHRLARFVPKRLQFFLHQLAVLRIERAERLVHQQNARVEGQGASNGDALLHAAGELGRIVIAKLREPDFGEQLLRNGALLGAALALHLEAPGNVAKHGAPRVEREFLEHHAAVGTGPGHRAAIKQ